MTRTTMINDRRPIRIFALAAAVALTACGDAQADGAATDGDRGESFVRVINVETTEVRPETFVEEVHLTGTVQANRQVTVSAEESGAIVETFVDKGVLVRAGQPIARIDDRLIRPQVDEARAQAGLAQETWERRRRLWEEDQVGSELAYLQARYAAEQAAARVATLEERLRRMVIEAPIEGVLDDRMVEIGSLVGPGTPIARIVDLTPVKVRGGVPERYAADITRGSAARVTFGALRDRTFEGTLEFVGAAVDAESRTFPVEFAIPNPGMVIKPEMVANIVLVRNTLENAVVVPQDAVVRVADGYVAFVVEGAGESAVVRSRPLVLGASQNNRVVVREGLAAGDRLVVVGQKQVAEGDRVRVVGEG